MEFRLLRADEIDCRVAMVQSWGISLLLYKDARCDMNILDETVGANNWQRAHELIDGQLFCNVGIWVDRRGEGFGEWVWKQDVGTESYTEKEKGRASDSFKRACFNWGIGRELYTAPAMFVRPSDLKTFKKDDKERYTCRDRFRVVDIEYSGRTISKVDVLNENTGAVITFGEPAAEAKKTRDISNQAIGDVKAAALVKTLEKAGQDVQAFLDHFNVKSAGELTEAQHLVILKGLEKKGEK